MYACIYRIHTHIHTYIHPQAELFSFAVRPFESSVRHRYHLNSSDPTVGHIKFQEKLASYFLARADPELQRTWRALDYRAARYVCMHAYIYTDASCAILLNLGTGQLYIRIHTYIYTYIHRCLMYHLIEFEDWAAVYTHTYIHIYIHTQMPHVSSY